MDDTAPTQTSGNVCLDAALNYANRGWHVLPLHTINGQGCSCRNPECRSAGKHPRLPRGLRDASIDAPRIRAWWEKWPEANIGVATGAVSRLVVLDIDEGEKSGSASLQLLEAEHGRLPNTLSCSTGNGRHLYFRHPGASVRNSVSTLGPGLDVRADGGYVVAPPSRHANGKTYTWVDPNSGIAPLPTWLLNTGPSHQGGEMLPVGARNDGLTSYAGRLRAFGMEQEAIEAAMLAKNEVSCTPPLPPGEVRQIVASVSQYPKGEYRPHLPWFQFFPNDWFSARAVRFGHDFQRGWYIQLLIEAWRDGGILSADPEMLWRLAGAQSKLDFERDDNHFLVLNEFELVQVEDGTCVWRHPWLAKHYQEQAAKYRQRCEAGARSAQKRRMQNPDTSSDDLPVDAA